jgi:histidyl-tRNA synthetase
MLGVLFGQQALSVSRSVPTCGLVALPHEDQRVACDRIAASLRRRGIPTEVAPSAAKFGKQIQYADRRGIPYVWFPGSPDTVKDIRSGDQLEASAEDWTPPADDLHPVVTGA